MYCKHCGNQLPDEAQFCWKCGKPQQDGIPARERQESCEIHWEVVQKKGLFQSGKIKFFAKAYGPGGEYYAGESPIFNMNEWGLAQAEAALTDLINHLLKDGWEYIGTYGEGYWEKNFKRLIL